MDAEASNQELLEEINELRAKLARAESDTLLWNRQLHAISKALYVGFWEWDEINSEVIYYSDEMAAIFDLGIDELYSRCRTIEGYYGLVHPDDLPDYKRHIGNLDAAKLERFNNAHVFEYRIVLPDGSQRHVRELEFGVFADNGDILRSYGVLQNITEHRNMLDALAQSEERFFTLFDQLPVGVVEEDFGSFKQQIDTLKSRGVDDICQYLVSHPKLVKELVAGTVITNVNQAMLDLNEASSRAEFLQVEADVDEWWGDHWCQFYAEEIAALASGEKFFEGEHVDSKVDGSYIETRSITTIVKGHEADWARVITIHEDITSRKKNEGDLVEAKNQAEKANLAKSEFLSSMSHELRTPLNAILGFSQLFSYDRDLTSNQHSNAQEINRAGKYLLELIDDILDLSRIEAGEVEVSLKPVSLLDAISDSLSWVEKLAESHSVKFHVDRVSLTDILVSADITRLKQVFLNLFTNAVKYNKRGGDVFIEIENRGYESIRIGVRDTGPGINKNKLGDLFQPFNRLGAEFSGTEGTGIGLVITRQLVELMNGKIEVQSDPGLGTTFWLELDLYDQNQIQHLEDITDFTDFDETTTLITSQPYILMAEDNVINRELMAAQMELLGYEFDYAVNGAQALEMWQKGKYYLLITDIRMPIMDGYELIREIRDIDITGSYPVSIIAITANAMQNDTERCFEAGADEVIAKPVELDQLRRALAKWVPREASTKSQAPPPSVGKMQSDSLIDLSVLRDSVGDKPDVYKGLLNSFLRSLPESIVDIEDAFSWRNHKKMAEVAHKLKSSARSMGATKLGELCQLLEQNAEDKHWPELEKIMPSLLAYCEQLEQEIRKICQPRPVAGREAIHEFVEEDITIQDVDLNVLIVDDDIIMHRVSTTMLNDMGIRKVHNALSGPKALDILQNEPDDIELIICDLNMPGMDGVEFIRHLARQHYSNSLILTSGEDMRILRTVEKLAIEHELDVLGTIQKPMTRVKLNELIEALGSMKSEGTMINFNILELDELKAAIYHEEFDVFFQPKIDIQSRQVSGAEVLVRWNHPTKGLIRPDAFIPMAEENQLINKLTNLVCKMALDYASQLKAMDLEMNIAINISVDTLNDLAWPDYMAGQVEDWGLQPKFITFEITESRLMEHISVALDIVSRLSLKRFNLSIDDFGTGYSSMEQLQRIPFSELKIDRAFVNGAADDSSARAILESSVLLAKKLEMKVVAEGVENQKDWDLLETLEVDEIQGYFIARPMPFEQFVIWLKRWQEDHKL